MMNKCRICFESKRNLYSTFDSYQGLSCASMITLLTGIKIVKDENDMICALCRRKLKDFYEFKILIERSDLELNKQSKVFKFNTIDDIKIEFPTQLNQKEIVKYEDCNNYLFQNDTECIYYNNTLIRRLIKQEMKTEPTEEFHNTIKSKGFEENDYVNDYVQDTNTDEEYKPKKKIKSKISKKKKSYKKLSKLIKPILLNDLIVIKTKTTKLKTKTKRSKDTLCPFCGKIFKGSEYLKKHILIHTAEKVFICHKCSKSFRTNKLLEYHIKSHSSTETYKCEHCIASFSSKSSINRHMLSHMKKQLSCNICKKEFRRKHALKRHMWGMHGMGSKSIHCDKCNMSFYTKEQLKAHYRVHTGERPFKCELCSQPYSYKRDFNRHCLKKHGVIVDHRPVHVMNEEVLKTEKALMKDLMSSLHGIPTKSDPMKSFQGPQKAQAFAKAVKVIQNGQIPIDIYV